jgi:hypothetical protein
MNIPAQILTNRQYVVLAVNKVKLGEGGMALTTSRNKVAGIYRQMTFQ